MGGRASVALGTLLLLAGCRQLFGLHPAQTDDDDNAPDAPATGIDAPPVGASCTDANTLSVPGQPDELCPWGCVSTGGPHCAQLIPSGGGVTVAMMSPAGLDDVALGSGTIDGAAGTLPGYTRSGTGVVAGIDFELAGGVAIFRVHDLVLSGALAFSGPQPIALVATGTLAVAAGAALDVRGDCAGYDGTAGPGGGAGGGAGSAGGGIGGGGGGNVATFENSGGGGGGGFGSDGGDGLDTANGLGDGGGSGGSAFGDLVAHLAGGGGGGGGGAGAAGTKPGMGGGGGGALQLISNGAVLFAGTINAGGCGGGKIGGSGLEIPGGGGGGAGGAILIEAPTLQLGATAALAVNGGGGGGNGNGAAGTTTAKAAAGGSGAGAGGAGGMGNSLAGGSATSAGGAGGGAVGRIRIETRTGAFVVPNGAVVSPAPTDSPTTTAVATAVTQ